MKLCKICAQPKPFEPTAKYCSKLSGFMGNTCWECYVQAQRLRSQGFDPKNIELDAELQARKAQIKTQGLEMLRAETYASIEAKFRDKEAKYAAWETKQKTKNAHRLAKIHVV